MRANRIAIGFIRELIAVELSGVCSQRVLRDDFDHARLCELLANNDVDAIKLFAGRRIIALLAISATHYSLRVTASSQRAQK